MAKKLTAKVNGVKVKDGEIVTLVVQARVEVREVPKYSGATLKEVSFQSQDEWSSIYVEAEEDEGKFTLDGVTIVKVAP